jgi:hypothetical protein
MRKIIDIGLAAALAVSLAAISLDAVAAEAGGTAPGKTEAAPPRGAGEPDGNEEPGAQGQEEQPDTRAPVLHITSIEVIRSTHGPALDIVRVRGLVSTPGWEEAELVPLTHGTPSDGVLDLAFIARAPAEPQEASGFEAIEAILPIETDHPYKAINVHGAAGSVTLNQLPGYAEAKVPSEDCSKCVGKFFVPKGAAKPAGKADADLVKEEDLPSAPRIIKSTDGLYKLESDPNRLTIIVNKDGQITTAFWE